jgi:Cof subfamily protein (haloacid dehalogenase superfamily)
MQKIRLIASDLDGTLLLNGAQDLKPEDFTLIRELKARNILFLAASGREYSNLQRLFAPVKDDILYLCQNGCLTVYHDHILSREIMKAEDAHALISAGENAKDTEVLVSGLHTCYIRKGNPSFYHHMTDIVHNHVTPVDDLHAVSEPYSKISLFESEGIKDLAFWKEKFSSSITVQLGGTRWIDCAPKGVNKATGFQNILEHLSIPSSDTIMFGDNENDREILLSAGTAIAVKTANPAILPCCSLITDTVEDALHLILQGKTAGKEIN